MRSKLAAAIAWRYLKKKKTHGAVGRITTVSVCAMAVAVAAIVCVLSVFNGFREVITGRFDTLSPDVEVTPSEGKVFSDAEGLAKRIEGIDGVAIATPTLTENALAINGSREMPVQMKGVIPEVYSKITAIESLIAPEEGHYLANTDTDTRQTTIAIGTAAQISAYPGDKLLLFAPKRKGRVNLANPVSSFLTDSATVTGVYRSDQTRYDENGIIVPIETARHLLDYDTEATAIEVKGKAGETPDKVAERIRGELGDGFVVKDRFQQQEMNFRMVSIEKWVSFMLLFFILVIASFNIISSLAMLVLEKQDALTVFSALGMSRRRIGAVFAWESIYVSAIGGAAGLALGVGLCLLQQHFGLIKIAGDPSAMIIQAYPVRLIWTDLLVTLVPIVAISLITAAITARFARSRIGF